MGIDIFHLKLTKTPNNEGDYFTFEDGEWDSFCNVPMEVYQKYIQDIEELEFDKEICIVKNKHQYNLFLKEGHNGEGCLKIFIGNLDASMRQEIDQLKKDQNLEGLEEGVWKIEKEKLKYVSISFGRPQIKKGIYYEVLGSQNKTMQLGLCKAFSKYEVHGKKEDMVRARTFLIPLDPWRIWANNSADENFQKDFLDNFVFGESWFWVSC